MLATCYIKILLLAHLKNNNFSIVLIHKTQIKLNSLQTCHRFRFENLPQPWTKVDETKIKIPVN